MKAQQDTVLIVEDDDDQRLFMELSFRALVTGYAVQGVRSGNEAIAYLKGEGRYSDRAKFTFPSYMITDLKMPDGDGFALLDFIRQNPGMSVIPIIMLSCSDDADDIRHAYLLGASSYIVKPEGLGALQALLKKIHEYWAECETPEVDEQGYALPTSSVGKAGARFPKPEAPATTLPRTQTRQIRVGKTARKN